MPATRWPRTCIRSALALAAAGGAAAQEADSAGAERLPVADGYRGIWYANQPSGDEYRYKYSGGFATYPQQHLPIACYSERADRTFFVYGGADDDGSLLHMVSWFDHATGRVPRPRVLLDKETTDAHDNPVLMLDDDGHLWVFSNAHGRARPSYLHRSRRPLSIDAFERVRETNFSYGQPWHVPGRGFCFLHTRYRRGRRLFVQRSRDGRDWEEPRLLAFFGEGHYQISWRRGRRIATALNYHPEGKGLNWRTNLYYLETADGGETWTNVAGKRVELPLREVDNAALVRDYESQDLLVYLKDLGFDAEGRPVVLFLTSRGYAAGPDNDPRNWRTAAWTGARWEVRAVTRSDHNYDFGSLYLEDGGRWRIIAPTAPGPQPYGAGGEIVAWTSSDRGRSWTAAARLTRDSRYNHGYARRPVHAHPGFYALWADGHARRRSPSRLYFATRAGETFRLPARMTEGSARPERVFADD